MTPSNADDRGAVDHVADVADGEPPVDGGDVTDAPAREIVDVATVLFALVGAGGEWFMVRLADGTLTVASPQLVDGRAEWHRVEDEFWGDITLDALSGMPQRYETIECPICLAEQDVTFPCHMTIADIYVNCAACGYRIDDVEQMIADRDSGGGTSEL
jgi:hypothetical protein